jgi:V-type H+-transporting ATPase subunit a
MLKQQAPQAGDPLKDDEEDMRRPILNKDQSAHELNYMCGVLDMVDLNRFQRIIFRVTKGNILNMFAEITLEESHKSMFMLIFPGGQHQQMKQKLIKVCDSFGITRFDVPRNLNEQKNKMIQV